MTMEPTDLERSVIEMLLAGNHPVLEALRRQFQVSSVTKRELTGCGFFTYFAVDRTAVASIDQESFRIGDVDATIPGLQHGAGFVLFVEDGYVDNLEGYTYDESWPASVSGFNLTYTGGSRDVKGLRLDFAG